MSNPIPASDLSQVKIFDTTLRDGMQGTGISYTLKDKIEIARRLDEMGFDYIEGGFPLANEKEEAFFAHMKKEKLSHARLAAFGSTRKPGRKAAEDPHILALLQAETPGVVVVGKAWMAHVTDVLGTQAQENLDMIYDSISYLKSQGREVIFDLEHFFDGWKAHPDYSKAILTLASDAGADVLVPCDTNGGTLVTEVNSIYNQIKELNLKVSLGGHFHNDLGLGVANSLAAVEGGAVHIQGTINGWGERCGNANLCVIVPNLVLKMGRTISLLPHLERLTELSRFVAEKANVLPDRRQPFVGEAAFSHKAGQHADVLQKAQHLMEHMDPALVGNSRKILLSELAGKSTVVLKMSKYGHFDKNSSEVGRLTQLLKEREGLGYEYEAAEASFELLILKMLDRYQPLFELDNYHLESFKTWDGQAKTVGRIFIQSADKKYLGAAVGKGPVGVLDRALRDALDQTHPFIRNITLTDFSVRVLNAQESHAEGRVRVFVTLSCGTESWDTVGVSENIVEASWEALVDGFEYWYNTKVCAKK